MIVVTGGAGFIGSAFVAKLNDEGRDDIVIVDELGTTEKWKNLVKRRYADYIHKSAFLEMVVSDRVPFPVEAVVHMGACSSTTERDADYLTENNFHYSCFLADWALARGVRFICASSAATYGDGALGFSDSDETTRVLRPINMYGYSKQLFDLRVLRLGMADRMAGVKFFNVFGPNEYHKGDMTSVVFKAFHQIRETGRVRLFKSYKPEYADGGQMRDFVYVKDCTEVLWWLLNHGEANGIFNLGTGRARTWNDLIGAVFAALDLPPRIDYIEMPEAIRGQYQYFTEAKMEKLRA
ncbi:MAG: ADP-glyceromanno-heptose 6-epimerase, partial [Proteobacteria bacterium]|nr:ADP-glyceromanno-heptose 6-epimerase [Pseudomonadota bacterium]